MARLALRYVLIVSLTLGLMLPKMGAVIVAMVPGVITAVICNGAEMVVISIDQDGQPIELPSAPVDTCVSADPTELAEKDAVAWVRVPRSFDIAFVQITHPAPFGAVTRMKPRSHAPPLML